MTLRPLTLVLPQASLTPSPKPSFTPKPTPSNLPMTLRPHTIFLPQASLTPSPKPSFTPKPSPSKGSNSLTPSPNSGLLFREKLFYLETHLNVNTQKALLKNPDLRACPLSSIISVERCLFSMGIERGAMGRIFGLVPELLTMDPHLHLYPALDFLLNEAAIPFADIGRCILRCPHLLIYDVTTQLRPTLLFLTRDLGFKRVTAKPTLLGENVEMFLPRIEYLKSLGFSHAEVVTLVVRAPGLLTISIGNNFIPKVEYLVREMKRDVKELKRFPQYFQLSLEGRIKPRHRLLAEHGLSLPLYEMFTVSDGEFDVMLIEKRLDRWGL